MNKPLKLLDVVALLTDLPDDHLRRGEVGTLVERLAAGVWLVEFSDNEGEVYALLALGAEQLMKLYYEPLLAAVE